MRRVPARPVRACFVRSCCTDVVQEHDLRATPVQCNAKRRLSSHFTLHSSHFTLHTSSHLRSCELFSPHLSSSHLIPSPLTCHLKKFFSTVFISSEHWSTFLISPKLFSTHLSCSARQKSSSGQHTEAFTLYTRQASRKYLCTTKIAHLPNSSVSQKSFVNTQKLLCKLHA